MMIGAVQRLFGVGIGICGLVAACASSSERSERAAAHSTEQALTAPFISPLLSKFASFKDGSWILDVNGNGQIDSCAVDRCFTFGIAGDIPVAGFWGKPGGIASIGVYRPSSHGWYLDYNHNGWWDGCTIDRCFENFVSAQAADKPIVGRWTGGAHQIGIYRNGSWFLDANGDGVYQASVDKSATFGTSSDRPVAGQWSGLSFAHDAPGIFGPNGWQVDTNGDFKKGTCSVDGCGALGAATDVPIAGKWHESSPLMGFTPTSIGTYRDGAWFLDASLNNTWDGCTTDDCVASFGPTGASPVIGDWAPIQWSTGADTVWNLSSQDLFENTAAVVPPAGKPSCPGGRAFLSLGQTAGGSPPTPGLEMVDLDKLTTTSPTEIFGTRLLTKVGATDSPGTDNQMLRLANNDLIQFRVGTRGSSPIHGSMYVWRSQDCGDTWSLRSTIRSDDANILGGRCRLRQGQVLPAVYNPTARTFTADTNGNFVADDPVQDLGANFGVIAGDVIVAGDWDGNGSSKIGRYRNGQWLLDMNGNYIDDGCIVDKCFTFGAAGETPLVGRWGATSDGDLKNQVGTFKDGIWHLDTNGDRAWNAGQDTTIAFGQAGDQPVVGSWDSSGLVGGVTRVGVFRTATGEWFLDKGANGWNGCSVDRCISGFGGPGQIAVSAVWTSMPNYNDRIGTFANGAWNRDLDNNGSWAGLTTEEGGKTYGSSGDLPLPGMWEASFGGFDRGEAYADPSNGMLYLTVSCDYRTASEQMLLSSNDVGATWKAQTIPNNRPTVMTSLPNGKLYLFSGWGDPMLTAATVTPSTNTVVVHPYYWLYQQHGAFLGPALPANSSSFSDRMGIADQSGQGKNDGSLQIAGLARTGSVDSLFLTYPSIFPSGGFSTQMMRNLRVDVTTGANSVSKVAVTALSNEYSTFTNGSVQQAVLVEGDPGSNQVIQFWKDISATSSAALATSAVKTQAEVWTLTGDNKMRNSGYITLSQSANGDARTWTGSVLMGDYQKGAVFTSGGLVNFLTHWVETPTSRARTLHTQILSVHP